MNLGSSHAAFEVCRGSPDKMMTGVPAQKAFFRGTHRLVLPATVARVLPMMRVAGITRVADVTRLDSIGGSGQLHRRR